MSGRVRLFTSESVSEGHPDKLCDQISDAMLDAMLEQDPMSRVACETAATTGVVLVAGEITTNAHVNVPELVRRVVSDIGYTNPAFGLDCNSCAVLTSLDRQSADIAMGVDHKEDHEQGAGDQGMMFGYACRETPELMPMPILLAHRLVRRLADLRKSNQLTYLRPDAKSQVTIEYENDQPVRIQTVVISTQHAPEVERAQIERDVIEHVLKPVLPAEMFDQKKTTIHVNPTGRFVIGGPHGDTGLTGRKIIVDTYGGMGRHGGGAFSGKDPSKVDRSAAYAARWVAKNVVAAGLADRCEIQISYAIGVAEPVSIAVDTFGTAKVDERVIEEAIRSVKLSPRAIIEQLNLRRPIYERTAAYGHFGRENEGFPWEDLSLQGVFSNID